MSHEIRTPLNGIIGFTNILLMDDRVDDDVKKNVKLIRESSESLLVVINDILDFSKIEAGKLEIFNTHFNLEDLIESVMVLFDSKCSEKRIDNSCYIKDRVPIYFYSDSSRIRQVLINLVGNAVKFTAQGGVKIFVDAHVDKDDNVELMFKVEDTGIGISEENRLKLFQSFEQLDAGTTKRFGGTGLGLAISQKLVKLMGGSFNVESKLGIGSSFQFNIIGKKSSIELVEKDYGLEDSEVSELNQNLKILIVEDNLVNQKVAFGILKKMGFEYVKIASNGFEGVNMVLSEDFDLVFMDIQMPEKDGLEATKEIIKELKNKKRPFIIGLSANAFDSDIEKALAVGMDDYLEKPFSLKKLTSILNKYSGTRKIKAS